MKVLVQVFLFPFLHHGHGVQGKFNLYVENKSLLISFLVAVFTIFGQRSVFQKWTEEDFVIADQEGDSVGRNKSLRNDFIS